MIRDFPPKEFDLRIEIEWPDIFDLPIPASRITVRDATDPARRTIDSINGMTIYCTSGNIVWAELEMMADLDGKPVLRGKPYFNGVSVITGVFYAEVFTVRSTYSYRQGYTIGEATTSV